MPYHFHGHHACADDHPEPPSPIALLAGLDALKVCDECGALVADAYTHDEFHHKIWDRACMHERDY